MDLNTEYFSLEVQGSDKEKVWQRKELRIKGTINCILCDDHSFSMEAVSLAALRIMALRAERSRGDSMGIKKVVIKIPKTVIILQLLSTFKKQQS